MSYSEFIEKYKHFTETLSYERQLKLAIAVCKRLYKDYHQFCVENNSGDTDFLLDTIKLIDQSLLFEPQPEIIYNKLEEIALLTPDTDNFRGASYALNACVSVCETLEFLLDKKAEHIFNVGTCLTDTVDFKIQEEIDLTDNEIDSHPDVIEARRFLLCF